MLNYIERAFIESEVQSHRYEYPDGELSEENQTSRIASGSGVAQGRKETQVRSVPLLQQSKR